jgi:hypothetical protein
VLAALSISAPVVLCAPAFADEPSVADQEAARTLAARGVSAYDQGDYLSAVQIFTDAEHLYPTPQYRIYMARSLDRLGKLVRAARLFEEAARMPRPDKPPRGFEEAQQAAREELAELMPRIPVLQIKLKSPELAQIKVDGQDVPVAQMGHVEVDPGQHRVEAAAPDFEPWATTVTVAERGVSAVEVHLVRRLLRSPAEPPPPGPPPPASPLPAPPVEPLSHRRQIGLSVRVDVDPRAPGARVVPGLAYGVIDYLEIGLAAIVGIHASGVEPHGTAYFLRSAVKPMVDVGAPVFVVQGARAGIRGSGGVQWDPIRHFGLFAQVGGAYFFNPPPGYVHGAPLLGIGAQGRL